MTLAALVKSQIQSSARTCALATSHLRPLPGFLIVGAQRSGTTSLYNHLIQHPLVAPSPLKIKELHFFDTQYSKGMAFYRAHFPTSASLRIAGRGQGQRVITGEASPYYMFHPHAPYRIARHLPEVKLIMMLRDPVMRAHSHYQHEVARGFETLGFEEAIDREADRLAGEGARMEADPAYQSRAHRHHSYVARGMYAAQLSTFRSLFAPEQLLVLQSEAFYADPAGSLERVLNFLGLGSFVPAEYRNFNPRPYSDMSGGARRRLQEIFAQPNHALYEALGADFGWATP